MINPIDTATTRAMIEYRQRQLVRDLANEVAMHEDSTPSIVAEGVQSIRMALGIRMIRAGARLAGSGSAQRMGAQL